MKRIFFLTTVLFFGSCNVKNDSDKENNNGSIGMKKSELCAISYDPKNNIQDYVLSLSSEYLYDVIGRYVEVLVAGNSEVIELKKDDKESRLKLFSYKNLKNGYIKMSPQDIESESVFILFKGENKDILAISKCDFAPSCEQTLTFIEFTGTGCEVVTDSIFPKIDNNKILKKLSEIEDDHVKELLKEFGNNIPIVANLSEYGTTISIIIDPELTDKTIVLFKYNWNGVVFSYK